MGLENNGKRKNGFYYDNQKLDKKTCISLHANTKRKSSDGGKTYTWVDWDGETFQDTSYGVEPICSGILTEDFGVSLTNNWAENSAGNAIQSGFNDVVRPWSPYVSKILDGLKKISRDEYSNEEKSTIVQGVQSGVEKLSNKIEKYGKYLDYALIVQGFRFTYYGGSSTTFRNLGLKFTLFPEWVNGKMQMVPDQINKIVPYVYGEFVSIADEGAKASGNAEDKKAFDEVMGAIGDLAVEYCNWQKPPAGFKPDTKNIDIVQPGTLRLNIGLSYCIENLVISECNIEYSKIMAKIPNNDGSISITPLYAEVSLQLQPATMFSDKSFTRFSSGTGMKSVTDKELERLNERMEEQKKGKKINSHVQKTY